MKIYIDLLIISNALITLVLVKLLSIITHSALKRKGHVLSIMFGAISSTIIILKAENFIESLAITIVKVFILLITVKLAFDPQSKQKLFSYTMYYIALNIVLGGICLAVWEFFGAGFIKAHNMTVYFKIPIWLLMMCVAATYFIITIYEKHSFRNSCKNKAYKAVFTYGDISLTLPAVSDSGNVLIDSFSGEPVVIFSSNKLYDYFELDNENKYYSSGFHLIPYSTVSSKSLMPVTLKGKTLIIESDSIIKEIKCAVGIVKSSGKERAIFNPKLLM